MPTPTAELAALTLELQRRGVIDVKFSWRPGAVEGLPASECMKGAADFIAEYLALQEPTLATRRMLEDAGDIASLRAERTPMLQFTSVRMPWRLYFSRIIRASRTT